MLSFLYILDTFLDSSTKQKVNRFRHFNKILSIFVELKKVYHKYMKIYYIISLLINIFPPNRNKIVHMMVQCLHKNILGQLLLTNPNMRLKNVI